jgi:nucleotide-binding universal stress UspA family protein
VRSIVCGVDDSNDASAALRVAAELARRLGLRLVVAHVTHTAIAGPQLAPAGRVPMLAEQVESGLEAGRRLVNAMVAAERLSDVDERVVYGFPAERLAELADDEAAELIVVGSRGRGALKAAFLGSVSRELIGVASCPVLVVPPGSEA